MKAAKHPKQPVASAPDAKQKRAEQNVPDKAKPLPSRRLIAARRALPTTALFIVYGLCLWKWINVTLIYHGSGMVQDFPTFYWGWNFASEFRTHPGGLVEYGSALLAQSLYVSWFGALVLTLQSALVYGGFAASVRRLGAAGLRLLCFVPPLLMLAVYCKYRHYSAPVSSFAIGVGAAWLWLRLRLTQPLQRLAAGLVMVAMLYLAAPSGLIVFVPAVVAHELFASTSVWIVLTWLALSATLPVLEGAIVFGFAAGEAYAKVLPLPWDPIVLKMAGINLVIALFCFPLVFWVVMAVWRIAKRRKTPVGAPVEPIDSSARSPLSSRRYRWIWELATCVALPLVVVWMTLNPEMKAFMQVDYYAWERQWPALLEAASRANSRNTTIASAIIQARYHTGTLTSQLPILTSPADLLLFNNKEQAHWRKSDLYFDLGYLNMALHHLTESVEFYGERPVLLRRLALVNIALGNISTAKIYLGTLGRAPFQGEWARDYLLRLQMDPTLSTDEEVARLRRFMVRRDSVVALTPEQQLLMLLDANRQNRMAFEYLMTYYLLSKNLDGFVKNISRVNDFSGLAISPMWDEALVLASRLAGRPLKITGHVISQEAVTRVETVTHAVQALQDNAVLARHKLAPQYGHTYTFYWWFHE
jgi:hypothetical protein